MAQATHYCMTDNRNKINQLNTHPPQTRKYYYFFASPYLLDVVSLFSTNLLTRPQPIRLQVPVDAERVVVVMIVAVMPVMVIVVEVMVVVMPVTVIVVEVVVVVMPVTVIVVEVVVVVIPVTVIVVEVMVVVMRSGGDGDCAICNFTEQTLDLPAPNHLLMHLHPQPPTLQPHNYPYTSLPHLR